MKIMEYWPKTHVLNSLAKRSVARRCLWESRFDLRASHLRAVFSAFPLQADKRCGACSANHTHGQQREVAIFGPRQDPGRRVTNKLRRSEAPSQIQIYFRFGSCICARRGLFWLKTRW